MWCRPTVFFYNLILQSSADGLVSSISGIFGPCRSMCDVIIIDQLISKSKKIKTAYWFKSLCRNL